MYESKIREALSLDVNYKVVRKAIEELEKSNILTKREDC